LKLQILRPDSCSASKNTLYMSFSAKSETKRAKSQSLLDPYKKWILTKFKNVVRKHNPNTGGVVLARLRSTAEFGFLVHHD
jgi:hypothetical protein